MKHYYKPFSLRKKAVIGSFLCLLCSASTVMAAEKAYHSKTDFPISIKTTQQEVNGKVTAANGEPLIGVTVAVKGTTSGVMTDADGNYSLSVPDGAVLEFSYVGYTTQTVTVDNRSQINITLEPSSDLEEVVVVGYGTQKRGNLTASIDVISGEALADRPATNVADLIKGASPNTNIGMNMRGGEPGAVSSLNIRGVGSISGNDSPLVLVDGVEMDLMNVDPETIENISILKDASASAIYGSRAPFGVILITTKSGKAQDGATIQYTNNLSLASPIKLPHFIDSYTWATAYNQANANAGLNPVYSDEQMVRIQGYLDGSFPYEYDPENPIDNIWAGRRNGNANNDWPHILMADNSFSQKHNLNVSGGSDAIQYYAAGGYTEQNGMYAFGYDHYKRYNLLSNLNADVTDWLKFNSSIKYAGGETDFPMGETTVGREHTFREMLMFAPMMPYYNINGTIQSPLIRLLQDSGRDVTKTNDLVMSLGGELEPIDGWVTTVSYNYNVKNGRQTANPRPIPVELGDGSIGNIGKPEPTITSRYYKDQYKLFNATTAYEMNADLHYFKGLLGFEQEESIYSSLSATKGGVITDEVPSLSTSVGEGTVDDAISHWATRGFFGRVNYNYDEKYLVEFAARYSGSSRFPTDKRWGFFPSASVGYNISKEDFWTDFAPSINNLKFRASYGSLGNQNVSNYLFLSRMRINPELNWILNNERPPYALIPTIISDNITWETITTLNLGVDARLLENRLDVTFEWYNRITTDMLGPAMVLPYPIGATAPRTNNAELSTKGFEIVLSWNDVVNTDFSYNAKLSLGDSRTKILNYKDDKENIGSWYTGKNYGEIWGYETAGIIQTEGEEMADQSKFHSSWEPGDIKYVDLNGDGVIDDGTRTVGDHGDLKVIGNTSPRYNIGFTGGFKWKSIDFSMFWQGVLKRDYYPHSRSSLFWGMTTAATASGLYHDSPALDYWRPADETNILGPNTDAYLPKPYFTSETNKNRQTQSRFLLDGSYLRLKNLQVGYSLSSKILERLPIRNARFYVSGENLLTISGLPKIFDPETSIASDPSNGGYLTNGVIYPMNRIISLGVNITLK